MKYSIKQINDELQEGKKFALHRQFYIRLATTARLKQLLSQARKWCTE